MRASLDLSVYYITAPDTPQRVVATALAAAQGGATAVQLRDKTLPDTGFVALGRALREALDPLGVPLIVNDRIALVAAIGAAGGHVGQGDMPPAGARDLLGEAAILGLSIETAAQCAGVDWSLVDHVGAGPVRATGSKADHAPPTGMDGLARLCARCPCPVVAIGGIGAADAPALRAAGAAGMAVISAIADTPDPRAAARILADAWRAA